MVGRTDIQLMDVLTDEQMDRHMDVLCETIIPSHYHVAGIKIGVL